MTRCKRGRQRSKSAPAKQLANESMVNSFEAVEGGIPVKRAATL